MFNKILIANRGEIACRIMRTAHRLGIKTVAVYSAADCNAQHVQMADEAFFIGESPASESYLNIPQVLEAARTSAAEAIHPGYGFLSENVEFALECEKQGIVFIGPSASAIEAMGSKSAAKRIMEKTKVPLVPGYHGEEQADDVLKAAAEDMGYPVLLKAVAGGGGKGMRQVHSAQAFDSALESARREAAKGFGDDRMLVEKYLLSPRHVEVQVFFDQMGNGIYLAERDCSVQRRHQKVIEEAPAPGMTDALRKSMGEAAVAAAAAIDYCGAGTVEFLLDEDGSFYFMEMNTRLQVEHPVTEKITGLDLVEWQLLVAYGLPLPIGQEDVTLSGHAFEARIYAEDPDNDFLPATGTLDFLRPPEETQYVRIDSGVAQGDEVSVFYDPMLAKLITWDESRDRALQRLTTALSEYQIGGTTTNVNFLYNLATTAAFAEAQLDTGFIEKHHAQIFRNRTQDVADKIPIAALALLLHRCSKTNAAAQSDPWSPWNSTSAWRMNQPNLHHVHLFCLEQEYQFEIEQIGDEYCICSENHSSLIGGCLNGDSLLLEEQGHRQRATLACTASGFTLYFEDGAFSFSEVMAETGEEETDALSGQLAAPMNGTIVSLLVEPGAAVEADTPLLVMEAMKMEHTICSYTAGTVKAFYFNAGDLVDGGAQLVDFEPAED